MIYNPTWINLAKAYIGTKEVPGHCNNDIIVDWAKELGGWIKDYYVDDSIPWCGLFVTYIMYKSGLGVYQKGLAAKEWLNWGAPCSPQHGAIMVYQINNGYHVNFYDGEYENIYYGLGGNQNDSVNISHYKKENFRGACCPSIEQLRSLKG